MADPKDVTFEYNVFDDGRTHLKVIGPGTPPLDFLLAAKKRLLDAVELWEGTQETQEPPHDERERAPTEPPREEGGGRPRGGATEPQCKKILAVCHRLDDKIVVKAIEGYAGAEWRLNDDGRCLPNWDFLQSLDKFKASKIIEKLERAEA